LNVTTIVQHESAGEFLANCGSWLSRDEGLNHGLLSLAEALHSNRHIHEPPFAYCHIASKSEILGCAIFAEPDGLVLSEMSSETSAALFPYLYDKIGLPSRIYGPVDPAIRLGGIFAKTSDLAHEIHSSWKVHRLDSLQVHNPRVQGRLMLATKDYQQLVSTWGREYDVEKPANVNIERFLLRKLEDRLLYFWMDEEPKSLATLSGTTCKGPRISAVYTPRSLRGQGYAFALVYELGKRHLESGRPYITLNTQMGDSVEKMYDKIGYRVVGKKVSVVFRQTPK
jgi:hypothetical protein